MTTKDVVEYLNGTGSAAEQEMMMWLWANMGENVCGGWCNLIVNRLMDGQRRGQALELLMYGAANEPELVRARQAVKDWESDSEKLETFIASLLGAREAMP